MTWTVSETALGTDVGSATGGFVVMRGFDGHGRALVADRCLVSRQTVTMGIVIETMSRTGEGSGIMSLWNWVSEFTFAFAGMAWDDAHASHDDAAQAAGSTSTEWLSGSASSLFE